MEWNAGGDW